MLDRLTKQFIKQYLITALWSSTDLDSDEPLDSNFSLEDIDLTTIKEAVRDCKQFLSIAENYDGTLDQCYEQLGHDFWLTRNGHGAGFWDGDYCDELGERLTDLANEFSSLTPMTYVLSDDSVKIEFA